MTVYSFPGARSHDQLEYLQFLHPERKPKRRAGGSKYLYVVKESVERKAEPIFKAIEEATGVTKKQIMSKSRKGLLPTLRAIIANELYEPGITTMDDIAQIIGLKNHTAVVHTRKRKMPAIFRDEYLRSLYYEIHSYLRR